MFEYDGRGNQNLRTGPSIPGGRQSITYNVFNLPELIITGSGGDEFSVALDYDASGQRVHTLRPDKEIWHFGGMYEKETDPTDPSAPALHRYSVFVGGQRVAQVTTSVPADGGIIDSQTRYFHYDRLGSVIAMSSADGTITSELDYDVYGEPKQPLPTPYGYTGHRHEQDLGLIDAGGRFYDPVFGVFLSADPMSPLAGSSPRLNRYAYVGYDPVNFVDPTGLFLEDVWNFAYDFGKQYVGHFYILPLNLLTTGRWETTWDSETTYGLLTAVAATAAGIACGAATGGNLIVAGTCAGAVGGGLGTAFAGGGVGDVSFGITVGMAMGMLGGAAGYFTNAAVVSLTDSYLAGSMAAAAASSGTSVGFQLVSSGEVNWAQVVANGLVSGAMAWHRGAQQDARAQEVGVSAGEAAAKASARLDFESMRRNAKPLPAEFIERYEAATRPFLQKAGIDIRDVRTLVRNLPGDTGGTTHRLVVLLDPKYANGFRTSDQVLLHEIGHIVQKRLLSGGASGPNGFFALENAAFGADVYDTAFTPLPGEVPALNTLPLDSFNLVSGSYPLEALADQWAKGVIRATAPGGDPLKLVY